MNEDEAELELEGVNTGQKNQKSKKLCVSMKDEDKEEKGKHLKCGTIAKENNRLDKNVNNLLTEEQLSC